MRNITLICSFGYTIINTILNVYSRGDKLYTAHVFPSHYSVTQELVYITPDMKEDVVAATGITPISSLMNLFPPLD